jgi:hypothetical protein
MRTRYYQSLVLTGLCLVFAGGCSSSRFNLAKKDKPPKPEEEVRVTYGLPWSKPKQTEPDPKIQQDFEKRLAQAKEQPGQTQGQRLRDHLQRAAEAERNGDYKLAEEEYRTILKTHPEHGEAHHRLGVIADLQNDPDSADLHYSQALAVDRRNPDLLSDVGYSHIRRGNFAESERFLKEALEINPYHRPSMSNLGLVYGKQGKYDDALAMFRQSGTERQAQQNMAELFPNGRPPGAAIAQVAHQIGSQPSAAPGSPNPPSPSDDIPAWALAPGGSPTSPAAGTWPATGQNSAANAAARAQQSSGALQPTAAQPSAMPPNGDAAWGQPGNPNQNGFAGQNGYSGQAVPSGNLGPFVPQGQPGSFGGGQTSGFGFDPARPSPPPTPPTPTTNGQPLPFPSDLELMPNQPQGATGFEASRNSADPRWSGQVQRPQVSPAYPGMPGYDSANGAASPTQFGPGAASPAVGQFTLLQNRSAGQPAATMGPMNAAGSPTNPMGSATDFAANSTQFPGNASTQNSPSTGSFGSTATSGTAGAYNGAGAFHAVNPGLQNGGAQQGAAHNGLPHNTVSTSNPAMWSGQRGALLPGASGSAGLAGTNAFGGAGAAQTNPWAPPRPQMMTPVPGSPGYGGLPPGFNGTGAAGPQGMGSANGSWGASRSAAQLALSMGPGGFLPVIAAGPSAAPLPYGGQEARAAELSSGAGQGFSGSGGPATSAYDGTILPVGGQQSMYGQQMEYGRQNASGIEQADWSQMAPGGSAPTAGASPALHESSEPIAPQSPWGQAPTSSDFRMPQWDVGPSWTDRSAGRSDGMAPNGNGGDGMNSGGMGANGMGANGMNAAGMNSNHGMPTPGQGVSQSAPPKQLPMWPAAPGSPAFTNGGSGDGSGFGSRPYGMMPAQNPQAAANEFGGVDRSEAVPPAGSGHWPGNNRSGNTGRGNNSGNNTGGSTVPNWPFAPTRPQ